MRQSNEAKWTAAQQSSIGKSKSGKVRVNHMNRVLSIFLILVLGAMSVVPMRAQAADDFAPFPAGENAALVKKTCTACHMANVVISTQYDEALAVRQYKKYVGEPDTAEARKVIKYLSTVLGEK
jgi:hypothetical protein